MAVASQKAPNLFPLQAASNSPVGPLVRTNHGEFVDQNFVGYMKPSYPDTPLAELHDRFESDGYIFIRGLIPRQDVLDVREDYFRRLQDTDILEPNTTPRAGIFNSAAMADEHGGIGALDRPTDSKHQDPLIAAHSSPQYLAFLSHSALRDFIRKFTGWKKDIILERTMLRHSVLGASSTAIHYDQIYLRAGNPEHEFLTAWVPLGDIAVDGGGLMYLEGSSDLGRKFEQKFTEGAKHMTKEERENAFNVNMMAGGALSQDAEEFRVAHGGDKRWLIANYQAGDVVFHNPYMIHCASKNQDKERRIRLSTDLRFYDEGMELDQRWRKLWAPADGL